jgi:hypothetical protein
MHANTFLVGTSCFDNMKKNLDRKKKVILVNFCSILLPEIYFKSKLGLTCQPDMQGLVLFPLAQPSRPKAFSVLLIFD